MYYQKNNRSSIIPIWYGSNGLLDYGKTEFNGSLTVKQPSVNSVEATIDNLKDSMVIYSTVVFEDISGAIVNGPIFSKYEINLNFQSKFRQWMACT